MRIVIDLQGAQAENRDRGIGRLAVSLAESIAVTRGEHDVVLALSGAFPESVFALRKRFKELLPPENVRVWEPLSGVSFLASRGGSREQASALLREAFLASLEPDVVLVMSLFEGLVDDAVASIGCLAAPLPTCVFLHDLIPLIHRDVYLRDQVVEAWYSRQLQYLRKADFVLCNSDSTKREAIELAGFTEANSFAVYAGKSERFHPRTADEGVRSSLAALYGLTRSFVMYAGGIDPRKNVEGLIRAFAALPLDLRDRYQLVIVCSIQEQDRTRLGTLAQKCGLVAGQLITTGYVNDDVLVSLYSLADVFVFPSLHEGFGLPALEAMACGCPVIASDRASLPEVVGRGDALFDPEDERSFSAKLHEVLSNDAFRAELKSHGLARASVYSWERSARLAIAAMERFLAERHGAGRDISAGGRRPRLAYVSPLPPVRSGIAAYSADLLRELQRSYEIDVIVEQGLIDDAWVKSNCGVRSAEWFRQHHRRYERVLYHFGNSEFHQHMFELLASIPGVVVLHDFFLSGVLAHMERVRTGSSCWTRELYLSHGYPALRDRAHGPDESDAIWKYPCSLGTIEDSLGVITHSDGSRRLARHWYGGCVNDWAVIPLLRKLPNVVNKDEARSALGIAAGDFLVCAFGMLGPSKLNHRLLEAWLASALASSARCRLVFVGECAVGEYGERVRRMVGDVGSHGNIHITGWVSSEDYSKYLAAADLGVQLRTLSRGETSAAVLDCMSVGLATIVNSNGSMANLDEHAVWKLEEQFTTDSLVAALEALWRDDAQRRALGHRAREIISTEHDPQSCAAAYVSAIERFYDAAGRGLPGFCAAVGAQRLTDEDLLQLSCNYVRSCPTRHRMPQLLVDVSELVQRDARSGIQRVVWNVLREWLERPPLGFRVEPVYATTRSLGYRYARRFTLRALDIQAHGLGDDPIEFAQGDIFVGLDLQPQVVPAQSASYEEMRKHGVVVKFIVYDLLPILLPDAFPPGAADQHARWLSTVCRSDGAICISRSVADELAAWLQSRAEDRCEAFRIDWFHLGADREKQPSSVYPFAGEEGLLPKILARKSFLMVGTIEPRKGHAQVLSAFESLWRGDVDANLVIVGKQGWMVEQLIDRIRSHPELGKRLFWLEGPGDDQVQKLYQVSSCLIVASLGEGFGLPLLEAAAHGLPILARDLPVFREVAGDGATYFRGHEPERLADAIVLWVEENERGIHRSSRDIPSRSWRQSAGELMDRLTATNARAAERDIGAESALRTDELSCQMDECRRAGSVNSF